jgi:hypothetical protein
MRWQVRARKRSEHLPGADELHNEISSGPQGNKIIIAVVCYELPRGTFTAIRTGRVQVALSEPNALVGSSSGGQPS